MYLDYADRQPTNTYGPADIMMMIEQGALHGPPSLYSNSLTVGTLYTTLSSFLPFPFSFPTLPCQQQSQRLTQKKKKTKCNDLLTHRTIKENPRNLMDATQNHTPANKPNPIKHPNKRKEPCL
jgi:hypothetical protein